jgi:transcription-repair coupling factor (superfamily II helicase)
VAGKVDVVIGTTKLLGRSLRFRNLGLVVVDEEHRFGVRQKEQLKKLATNCHYLAMTATPIPRTLQLALAGIRSLSVLATPPQGRKAIRTEIVRFSKERVREDVLHELRRGGQVFFLHNRVQSIEGVATWLRRVVPEARVAVAHGQMDDDALEAILVRFVAHEYDVLVCTTIVESGVDMPRVNTLLVNRADTFGLAQLYQLRGRIGRSNVSAACTLLVGGTGQLRKEAMQRLRTLQENSELGSNFALASADLEFRGGGEILGNKQHGHIAAIGFDAYLELLQEAVAQARGEDRHEDVEPEIEVNAPAWIPEDYLPDLGERLDAYQALARARTREEVRRILGRLEQRHGELPQEGVHLGWLSESRVRARALGLARIAVLKVRVIVEPGPRPKVNPETLVRLLEREPNRFRRHGDSGIEMRFTPDEGEHPFRLIEHLLARLEEQPPKR